VLDASVAIAWCFPGEPTEDTPYARRVLSMLAAREAWVPEVWPFEIANTLFVSFNRRKRITERQTKEYLELLTALPIRVELGDLWANVRLESRALEWNLPAYDAAYLELALRKHLPLATSDDHLKKVALAEGIQVVA